MKDATLNLENGCSRANSMTKAEIKFFKKKMPRVSNNKRYTTLDESELLKLTKIFLVS